MHTVFRPCCGLPPGLLPPLPPPALPTDPMRGVDWGHHPVMMEVAPLQLPLPVVQLVEVAQRGVDGRVGKVQAE